MQNEKKNIDHINTIFSEIYIIHYEALCRFAFRFFNDEHEASDIVQDIMLKLWEQREKLKDIQDIKKYLFRSVYNSCLNKLEHIRVKKNYAGERMRKLLLIETEDFERVFYEWDIQEKMSSVIAKLTPKTREVFEMRYIMGMSYKEIANEMSVSERTVETHLQNALKILRIKFKNIM